jgi:hypothetical protein
MSRRRRPLLAAFCVLALTGGTARGAEAERPVVKAITDAIESCVGSAAIRFRDKDKRVLLEAADADAVGAAIVRRYPMVEQDGLAPQGLVLWQQPQFSWVYVALFVDPSKASEVCFTASFGADKFEMTPALIDKYFGADAAKK